MIVLHRQSSVVLIVLSWVVLLSLVLSLPPFFHFTRDNRCYRITLKTWRKSLFLSKIRARLWWVLRANHRHRSLFPETLLVCGRKTAFAFRPTHGGGWVLGVARTFTSRCDWSVYPCHNSSSFSKMSTVLSQDDQTRQMTSTGLLYSEGNIFLPHLARWNTVPSSAICKKDDNISKSHPIPHQHRSSAQ